MLTIRLKAHFDGQAIQLDEPFELSRDAQLMVTVLPSVESPDSSVEDSATSLHNELEGEPDSVPQHAELDDWIREVETLAEEVDEGDGPRLQSAVAEVRRQARDLARRGMETLP